MELRLITATIDFTSIFCISVFAVLLWRCCSKWLSTSHLWRWPNVFFSVLVFLTNTNIPTPVRRFLCLREKNQIRRCFGNIRTWNRHHGRRDWFCATMPELNQFWSCCHQLLSLLFGKWLSDGNGRFLEAVAHVSRAIKSPYSCFPAKHTSLSSSSSSPWPLLASWHNTNYRHTVLVTWPRFPRCGVVGLTLEWERLTLMLFPGETCSPAWNSCFSRQRHLSISLSCAKRPEIPSGMCAKLRTMAASNNREHASQSLLLLLARTTYIMVLFFTHIPFVVNHTINATPPESLQHYNCRNVDEKKTF